MSEKENNTKEVLNNVEGEEVRYTDYTDEELKEMGLENVLPSDEDLLKNSDEQLQKFEEAVTKVASDPATLPDFTMELIKTNFFVPCHRSKELLKDKVVAPVIFTNKLGDKTFHALPAFTSPIDLREFMRAVAKDLPYSILQLGGGDLVFFFKETENYHDTDSIVFCPDRFGLLWDREVMDVVLKALQNSMKKKQEELNNNK